MIRNILFLLAGHKVDFIAPCGANKSTFWPARRKKIVCNTGKTFILLEWLLPSLCLGIKLHTRKIIFFSLVAQCTNILIEFKTCPADKKMIYKIKILLNITFLYIRHIFILLSSKTIAFPTPITHHYVHNHIPHPSFRPPILYDKHQESYEEKTLCTWCNKSD